MALVEVGEKQFFSFKSSAQTNLFALGWHFRWAREQKKSLMVGFFFGCTRFVSSAIFSLFCFIIDNKDGIFQRVVTVFWGAGGLTARRDFVVDDREVKQILQFLIISYAIIETFSEFCSKSNRLKIKLIFF